VQNEDDAQATALRKVRRAPGGLGVGWMRHLVPSHRSARVTTLPARVMDCPAAVHAEGAVQATPFNALTCAPAGLAVRWMLHFVPFHRSASVTPAPEALT
jgi:hypothetical protein